MKTGLKEVWQVRSVKKDGEMLNRFCDALQNEDTENIEKLFTEYLRKSISIRDTAVRTDMKENYYHDVLIGILEVKDRWGISSNRGKLVFWMHVLQLFLDKYFVSYIIYLKANCLKAN
ncbi:hypothetical protein IMSAGC020_00102 [Lachnospiraceae bacterium]|jgi:hypothetical protein|nr:hypothetical protein IMSAGC020_00102 [Lachnospiraceae bacterium]